MSTKSLSIDAVWKKAILVVVGLLCALASWFFSQWGMAGSAAVRAEDADVAQFLTGLAPSDPQTHYAAAVLLEKSFEPDDIRNALREYETAAALAPENYLYWFDLGKARDRSGDAEGAERALKRSLELAPNYARVQWALGNNLLRQGRNDEAFAEIRKAVASDPASFAGPGAVTAWQFFGNDTDAIKRVVGGLFQLDAAIAGILVREKRYDEAMEIWRRLPPAELKGSLRDASKGFLGLLLGDKQFRYASEVSTTMGDAGESKPGQITNGGFESAVKPTGAGPFEWLISDGLQPQIVLSSGQRHGGNNSLLVLFNSADGKEFRSVSQLIAVEPNTSYEIEIFYRSDIKSQAALKWEVLDALTSGQLAVSEAMPNAADWTPVRIRFKSSTTDGVVLRLIRDNCGQICPITGSIGFDDISLKSAGER